METAELFAQMLNLNAPWEVGSVSLHKPLANPSYVLIKIKHAPRQKFACIGCGTACPVADHGKVRQWRHLDSMEHMTLIETAPPRTKCEKCGVKTVQLPWAEPHGRFTLFFEAYVILQLLQCKTYQGAARMARIDYDAVDRIVERAVERGLLRRGSIITDRIGMDETQWKEGRMGESFVSVLTDLKSGHVLEVVSGKDSKSAEKLLQCLKADELTNIKVTCSDFASTFTGILKAMLSWAIHVHDKFHVIQLATKAVDAVRRAEFEEVKGKTGEISLKGSRFKLLKTFKKLSDTNQERLKIILSVAKKTAQAHEAKESLVAIMSDKTLDKPAAEKTLESLCEVMKKSTLRPLKTMAKTLMSNLDSVTNYFKVGVTNAGGESTNSRIKKLIAAANGIDSVEAIRSRTLFFLGGLSMLPEGLPEHFWDF